MKHHLLRRTPIVGTSFRTEKAQEALYAAAEGAALHLIPEDGNPHDRYAVKVVLQGKQARHVGYIPAHCAGAVRFIMATLGQSHLAASLTRDIQGPAVNLTLPAEG